MCSEAGSEGGSEGCAKVGIINIRKGVTMQKHGNVSHVSYISHTHVSHLKISFMPVISAMFKVNLSLNKGFEK